VGGCVVASKATVKNVNKINSMHNEPVEELYLASLPILIIIKSTGGVTSLGDPSKKVATQTTSVSLYSGIAGIVSVSTRVPLLSRITSSTMPWYSLEDDPFISQLITASIR
jgi:hypothetical protein